MRRDVGGWMVRWDDDRAAAFVRMGAWADKTVADGIVRPTWHRGLHTDNRRQ